MLPAPNLDDRSWDDICDDIKRRIAVRCPEWTEHNASDPGVTLIELFAWMVEMNLYRLNQVPDKNYVKFLDMLGVALEPPTPATTELRFELARPIEDLEGEDAFELTLPPRSTIAATVRTETEEAIEFATDAPLKMVRPHLVHVMAVPRLENEDESWGGLREFSVGGRIEVGVFPIFSPLPRQNNAFYLGFANDVSGNLIELQVECVLAAATGLDEEYPAQVWEVWNGHEQSWERLETPHDNTIGFNDSGTIHLAMPARLRSRTIGDKRGFWVRVRYTTSADDLPPRAGGKIPAPYQRSPEIIALQARTIGGMAAASNSISVSNWEAGRSDGLAGQVFALPHAPILARRPDETILSGEQNAPIEEYVRWQEVSDFSQSGEKDRHFVMDAANGEIVFGPSVPEPDGSARQYGAIVPKGHTILFSAYRYGGGILGNVRENQVRVLKSSIPYIAHVFNPLRAIGGRDAETLERAKLRGQSVLKQRERAVTAEDYEYLAQRASSGVGRAHCVQPRATRQTSVGQIAPGVVRVLLVPELGANKLPHPRDLQMRESVIEEVSNYLDERRLLTTILETSEPDYLWVSTDITLVADPNADPEAVAQRVQDALERWIHPLSGGPGGVGWPFGRVLTLADIYAQVQSAHGVAFLLSAEMSVSRLLNRNEGLLGPEFVVPNSEGVRPLEHELLCTREHRVVVRPMWSVGLNENEI